MLEHGNDRQIERLLELLPCNVQLPAAWRGTFFSDDGVQVPSLDERRRFIRRSLRTRALLRVLPTLSSIERASKYHSIYTWDISRQGMGFLHFEQLFPKEQCEIWLPSRKAKLVVAQCRYIGERCFAIGAKVLTDAEFLESRHQ